MIRPNDHKISFAVFPVVIFVILGCSDLSRFAQSGNTTTSNSTTSDNKTSVPSGSVPSICSNAYYPIGENVVRKYRVTYPKGTLGEREYTETFSGFTGDSFVVNTDFDKVKAHINWKCTPEGLLATQYNNTVNMTKTGGSASVETKDFNGVTLPPEDRWQSGEKWQAEYHVTESLNAPDGKEMGGGDGIVTQNGEIVGSESITVPAGTFDTIKAVLKTDVDITVTIKGMSIPMKVPIETTAYFAKGTGMVKSVTKMGSEVGDATSELLSISK